MEREPVMKRASAAGVAGAALVIISQFVEIPEEVKAAILTLVVFLAPIVAGWLARAKVTPVAMLLLLLWLPLPAQAQNNAPPAAGVDVPVDVLQVLLAGDVPSGSLLDQALAIADACGETCRAQLLARVDSPTTFGLPIRPCRAGAVGAHGWLIGALSFAAGQGADLTTIGAPAQLVEYSRHPAKLVIADALIAIGEFTATELLHKAGRHGTADLIDCATAGAVGMMAYRAEQLVGLHPAAAAP